MMRREGVDMSAFGFSKEEKQIQRLAAEKVTQLHQQRDAQREQRRIDRAAPSAIGRRNPEADIHKRLDRQGAFGNRYTTDVNFDSKVAKPLNDARPKFGDFQNIYSLSEIRADQEEVKRIEQSPTFKTETGSDAAAFEYSVVQGVRNGMLGEGVTARLSAKFDDMKGRLDGTIGFPSRDGTQRYYVGFDATTSSDPALLDAKLAATAATLRQKKTSVAKYFIDHDNPEIRGAKSMPRAVLSVDMLKAQEVQRSLSAKPDYDLESMIGEEIAEELELQLTQGALFLLERFYGPSATQVHDAEDLLIYWQLEKEKIQKHDPALYNVVLQHIEPLEALVELEKKNNPSEPVTGPAGAFLTSLRRRVY